MPSVDLAMERSIRGGALDLLARAVQAATEPRDALSNVGSQISDVKTAFSSWDNCMQANYCKYVGPSPSSGAPLTFGIQDTL